MPTLPRLQLFEFNDLSSAPTALRETIVESLGRTLDWGHILDGLATPFAQFIQTTGASRVVDLGSGTGAPASLLANALARRGLEPPTFTLTDLYPAIDDWRELRARMPHLIDFVEEPVDATALPASLSSEHARTVINVLHHFPEELVRAVFADAIRHDAPIFIAEGFERNPLQFLNFAPMGVIALGLNPILARKRRLGKALLTWATPIALGASIWDGFVSTLRVYTPEELREIVSSCPGHERYRWSFGHYTYPPLGTGYYFFGVPDSARVSL